jgi:hypothetical protein
MPNTFPEIKNLKMRAFMEKGMDFIQQTKKPYTVEAGTQECTAWLDYFDRHIGARPIAVQLAIAKPEGKFTAPAQWPQWFDSSAAA